MTSEMDEVEQQIAKLRAVVEESKAVLEQALQKPYDATPVALGYLQDTLSEVFSLQKTAYEGIITTLMEIILSLKEQMGNVLPIKE